MDDLNGKLLKMCTDSDFNKDQAIEIIQSVELNQELVDPNSTQSRTSFLAVAIQHANLIMVKLLLEHGADPNFIIYEDKPLWRENPFWDLQYNDFGETAEENEVGLQMAQLMLEHGANPNLVLDDEDLFSYVCFAVFNDDDTLELQEYRSRFFILLIAYGGKNDYCKPQIIKEFDKSNMAQYSFLLVPAGDGYHLRGEILDQNYEVIARI